MEGVNCCLRGILGLLSGIVELRYDTLSQVDGHAVVREDLLFGLGAVSQAVRIPPSLPTGHEMIGSQDVEEELARVTFELTENCGWELVVCGAERSDPSRVWKGSPALQVSREAYEFFSRAMADFGLLTSKISPASQSRHSRSSISSLFNSTQSSSTW